MTQGLGRGCKAFFLLLLLGMQERSERCLQHVETNKITEKHMPPVRYSGEIAVE